MKPFSSNLFAWKYQHLLKPIFFLLDAELVHNQMTTIGKMLGAWSFSRWLTKLFFAYHNPNLEKTIDGIVFPNPVGLSAGFDYNGQLTQILPAVGFGFHTIGTVTWQPYAGNPKPRLGRLPASQALIVNKGLKNIGTRALITQLEFTSFAIPTGVSIASTNTHFENTRAQILDILQSFTAFENSQMQHAYYELNISCPNTFGGEPFTTPERLSLLLRCMDKLRLTRPLYLKMPIDLTEAEFGALLKVADKHNVQGLIIGNLTKDKNNPDVLPADRQTWGTRKGNLSGKPTWQRSNHLIAYTRKTMKKRFTIIGVGGIFNGEDAQHKLELGADLLQLVTGMIFTGPQVIGQINHHLATANKTS